MAIEPNNSSPQLRLVGASKVRLTPTQQAKPALTTQRADRVVDSVEIKLSDPTRRPADQSEPIKAPTPEARRTNNQKLVANVVQADPIESSDLTPPPATRPSPAKQTIKGVAALRFYGNPADQAEAFTRARSIDVQA